MIQGEQIGLAAMLEDPDIGFYSRTHQSKIVAAQIAAETGEAPEEESKEESKELVEDEDELVDVPHKSTFFMLMMSKDDNLLLQMGGLIQVLTGARFLTDELKG